MPRLEARAYGLGLLLAACWFGMANCCAAATLTSDEVASASDNDSAMVRATTETGYANAPSKAPPVQIVHASINWGDYQFDSLSTDDSHSATVATLGMRGLRGGGGGGRSAIASYLLFAAGIGVIVGVIIAASTLVARYEPRRRSAPLKPLLWPGQSLRVPVK